MIQITGLTKVHRRGRPPALLDLSFDARPGVVTVLLGAEGAGKTTALRLMVELDCGLGVTLFDGRTYRRIRRPEREIGVLLPTGRRAPGHPGRKARGHLRMLAGAVGVPARRADELLEQTRLATVADHRLRAFSPGMSRRLELAAALLGDPRTLLLDAPTEGLSPRNEEWFHSFLRSFAVAGGTVLVTTRTPQEAADLGDRVITLDRGRLVADQPVAEFRRTRLHPEVSVRGPQMARLTDLLLVQGAQVRRDGSAGIAVSGVGRTEIGELAYRHGILLHELADRVVEQPVPHPVLPAASGRSGHVQLQPAGPGARPPAGASAQASEPSPEGVQQPLPAPDAGPEPVRAALVGQTTPAEEGAVPPVAVQTALRSVTSPRFREEESFHDQSFHDQSFHDQPFHNEPFPDHAFHGQQLRDQPVHDHPVHDQAFQGGAPLHGEQSLYGEPFPAPAFPHEQPFHQPLDQPAPQHFAGPDHRSE